MKIIHGSNIRNLILGTAMLAGLGPIGHVTAQERFPFLIDLNTRTVTHLERLGGATTVPQAINESGQVAGYYFPPSQGGLNSLVDLPPGVLLMDAQGINNGGQVIATGIPEPETYALMLAGLGLVGFMARRKKAENRSERL
jgi:hypothetical protein